MLVGAAMPERFGFSEVFEEMRPEGVLQAQGATSLYVTFSD